MRIIKTQQDFEVLRRAGRLPAALLDQIEDYFLQLREKQKDEDNSEFCLDGRGYIVVLKTGYYVHDLGTIGLNRKDGGLLYTHLFGESAYKKLAVIYGTVLRTICNGKFFGRLLLG